MDKNFEKINLLGLDLKSLEKIFIDFNEKSFRAVQVLKWIHQYKITDFALMTNLSKSLRDTLSEKCSITIPKIEKELISSDGTIKWIIKVSNNNFIETVFIPEKNRGTLCISSQVGCALKCSFCKTGTMGFKQNLTSAEIIGQLWLVSERLSNIQNKNKSKEEKIYNYSTKITNVVLMGMGEPLLNLDNVVKAINIMIDDNGYGLAKRKVTVSTAGIAPKIEELAKKTNISLAISLHAPNNELRSKIMPINKKYPIEILLKACKNYLSHHPKAKITIEYLMIKNLNDDVKYAKQLVKILQGISCKVNLIPFNDFSASMYSLNSNANNNIDDKNSNNNVDDKGEYFDEQINYSIIDDNQLNYVTSDIDKMLKFSNVLIRAGIIATIRKSRGSDISAACGQLVT